MPQSDGANGPCSTQYTGRAFLVSYTLAAMTRGTHSDQACKSCPTPELLRVADGAETFMPEATSFETVMPEAAEFGLGHAPAQGARSLPHPDHDNVRVTRKLPHPRRGGNVPGRSRLMKRTERVGRQAFPLLPIFASRVSPTTHARTRAHAHMHITLSPSLNTGMSSATYGFTSVCTSSGQARGVTLLLAVLPRNAQPCA